MARLPHSLVLVGALVLVSSSSPAGAATSPYDRVASLGVGTLNCGQWLRTPNNEHVGEQWILGFVTGINTYGTRRGNVGAFGGQLGVINEVRGICQYQPALPLQDAAGRAYNTLLLRGR